MTASSAITMSAPAKLTWSLRITGRRADGYHLLDAEMVSLDLCDLVRIEPELSGVVSDGPFADGVPTDGDNLVVKALDLVGRRARVTVTKNIPHGGGLGGGSADAAAILRWAGWTTPDQARRGAVIGADVPFCVIGGRARVTGIGEEIAPLPFEDRVVTLVVPPLRVSTPAVYRAWDALNEDDRFSDDSTNDLEAAAMTVEPELVTWRDRIRAACDTRPILAGSGATWFVPGDHGHLADRLVDARVIVTRTIPSVGSAGDGL
ncbi:MAG: 4-(cytidine 5'-diphospho)-2-C-methyl-D-erythritol kinase [Actinomycetota bacterium]